MTDEHGYGYGYGDGITLPENCGIQAFHFVARRGDRMVTRDGRAVQVGDTLHEPELEMCKRGLHASLCRADAQKYMPDHAAVCTRVLVWGRVVFSTDKLVANYRKIVEVLDD
jgi:hypothetical protein